MGLNGFEMGLNGLIWKWNLEMEFEMGFLVINVNLNGIEWD